MSDETVRALVLAELEGLDDAAKVLRAGDLIELLNRVLVVELSDEKALAALRMRDEMDSWEITAQTGISPQQVRKLLERARIVRRVSDSKTAV